MRLTWKLTFAISCVILVVMSVTALMRVKREVDLFERDIRQDHRTLGRAVAGAAAKTWRNTGVDSAFGIVEDANERESHVQIRWVWLDGEGEAPELPAAELRALGVGDELVSMRREREGEVGAIYTYVPIRGPRPAAVELRESLDEQEGYVRRTILGNVLYTAALLVICGTVVLALGAIFVGRPARQLMRQAQRVASGDLEARLDLPQRDEMGELARELNAMATHLGSARERLDREVEARLAALEQVRRADRLATVGQLASGLAHEIGTPLNVVGGRAKMIASGEVDGEDARDCARIVSEQAQRIAAIIRQLLDFSRKHPPENAMVELVSITQNVLQLLGQMARKRDVTLTFDPDRSEVRTFGDARQLQQAFTNLLVNAIQATDPEGRVEIAIEADVHEARADTDARRWIRVRVRDTGGGMDPSTMEHVFEPFFTTKDVGEGTGLGLAVTHGIVHEHGGFLEVESEVGKGSTFTVYLPAQERET